jgi:predicted hotdog family 3-hydroxylacyl-ACP dehydratase
MNATHNIAEWIPQRPPFVFIDTIVDVSEEHALTQFTIPADCVLVSEGCLSLAGLMEHAAQTCAARAGWVQRQQGQQVKIGYIGAVKQLQTTRLPRVGETLTTEARVIQQVLNISLVDCITRVGDEQIATTTLKLATID